MNFKLQRLIVYAMGTLFVLLWAVFGVLSYFPAMVMASGSWSIALVLEAQQARAHHEEKIYRRKIVGAVLLIILCLLMILE